MDLNKWTGIGRLTKDATISYTNSGTACVKFSIASNRRARTDANGQKVEESDFFDVTTWGKLGENLKSYLVKGKQIAIEGRLQQDRWVGNDGQKYSKVGIIADNIQLLGGTHVQLPQQQQGGENYQQGNQYQGGNYQQGNQYQQPQLSSDFSEDMPF
jgi:single-strand DNA-binding protein